MNREEPASAESAHQAGEAKSNFVQNGERVRDLIQLFRASVEHTTDILREADTSLDQTKEAASGPEGKEQALRLSLYSGEFADSKTRAEYEIYLDQLDKQHPHFLNYEPER